MKNNYIRIGFVIISIIAIIVAAGAFINSPEDRPLTTVTNTFIPSTSTSTNTPDPCSTERIGDTVSRFDRLSREFNDAFVLAQNTPAAQLSTNITELQRIRRAAEDFVVPGCLDELKRLQLGFMNSAIDATITLYSNFSGDPNQQVTEEQVKTAVLAVNQSMTAAQEYSFMYTVEMGRLLGITLTPSPTIPPSGTETVDSTPTP